MADSADDGNATRSRRLKGQAIKAWQFLIPKKRNRQVLSSDNKSSINNQVSIRLSPSARNFIIPFKPKGPAKKTKNKILSKILPKKKSAKEQSTNDKESISEVRDTYPMYITNILMIRPPSSPPTLQFKKKSSHGDPSSQPSVVKISGIWTTFLDGFVQSDGLTCAY